MKLTILILITTLMQVSAVTFGQKVTLTKKNITFEGVFWEIRKQTGYNILIENTNFKTSQRLDVDFNNTSLPQVMSQITKGRNLVYMIDENTIVIKEISPSFLSKITDAVVSVTSFNNSFGGTVTDSLGRPLSGASVTLKGIRSYYASTDNSGKFNFKSIVNDKYDLTITYVGYQKYQTQMDFSTNVNVQNQNIVLKASTSSLDQVQVIAYGTNTKRFSVGSVATVTAADIEKQPVTNVLLALQGQVPGLTVAPSGGAPGSAVQIQIRGQNTIRNTTKNSFSPNPFDQPLFIVDGIPFAPQNKNLQLRNSLGGASNYNNPYGGMSPFNSINPQDIESVSILKDADATSIYGSQGANGVVLITTKKGKAGKVTANFTVNTGPNKVTRMVDMMNTQQYLQLRRDAFANDGVTPTIANAPDLQVFDNVRYTNWFREFFDNTSNNTDVHGSVSGGSSENNFLLSTGYTNSTYNFPGDLADQRYTMHGGFHHNSQNRRVTIDFGTDYSYDDNNSLTNPVATSVLTIPPNAPDLIDEMGNLIWTYKGIDLNSYQKFAFLKQPSYQKSYNLNTNLTLGYNILPGLNVKALMGYSRFTTLQHTEIPLSSVQPGGFQTSSASFGNTANETLDIEPQINYQRAIGNGSLSVLFGGTYKKDIGSNTLITASNYANDALLGSVTGGSGTPSISDGYSLYKYAAVFGRIGYVYDQKYIISLTGRRDGSSNFGPGRQFGNFGSAGLGWIFSEEKGFKQVLPFISYAKLSGSYGTSGSDGVGPYQYQPNWKANVNSNPFQGIRPYNPANLYNQDYSWGTKRALNTTLELGFFQDRLFVNGTFYRNRMGNQLIGYTLPIQTGFDNVTQNFDATVQDQGWEFTLTYKNSPSKAFGYSSSFNLSFNRNKLIAFPGLASSSYASFYSIGHSTNTVFGFNYLGVNSDTGIFEFLKADGTPTYVPDSKPVSQGGDWTEIADTSPKFYGGFNNTFSYKGLSLSLFFQFSKQTAFNYLYAIYSLGSPGSISNLPAIMENYWKKPGDISVFQMPTTNNNDVLSAANRFTYSTGSYSDDTYIRLKTLSLSYNLPDEWLKNMHIKNCSLYLNAQNLLTFTNYKVGDPEMPGRLYAIPMQRIIAAGLSFNF